MYPNLYYVFKDWFGVEWNWLKILNTFGLMVAMSFIAAAIVISSELKRKEKLGLLHPREEMIIVGKPASFMDLLINAIVGFLFGYKVFGLLFNKAPEINAQEYIFSKEGNILGGLVIAAVLAGLKWFDKNKQKLKTPERRAVRIWPHDRVGDIVILALVFGILGAKLFDAVEHLDQLLSDPIGTIFSPSGLTFYGGLIVAAVAVCWFGVKKGIKIKHLVDSAAPALMIAYAIGRIGCQVSGDGDWGVYNSAYVSDNEGNVSLARPGDFERKLKENEAYFTEGKTLDTSGRVLSIDRPYGSLDKVPYRYFKGPSYLPTWFFAYSFPQNVNNSGIIIPGIKDEHNHVLPQPVIPTSLYETLICSLFFLILWAIRKRITIPLIMFGIYLILNGTERFMVETIRVNRTYSTGQFSLSQAEIIALLLIISGLILTIFAKLTYKKGD